MIDYNALDDMIISDMDGILQDNESDLEYAQTRERLFNKRLITGRDGTFADKGLL